VVATDAAHLAGIEAVLRGGPAPTRGAILPGNPGGGAWREALAEAALGAESAAIIAYPAPEGTASAFSDARAKGSEARLVAVAPKDPPYSIQEASDLAIGIDIAGIARQAVLAAKRLGAAGIVALGVKGASSTELAEVAARAAEEGLHYEATMIGPSIDAARSIKVAAKPGSAIICLDLSLSASCIEALEGGTASFIGWLSPEALGARDLRGLEEAMLARGFAGRSAAWPLDGEKALLAAALSLSETLKQGSALSEQTAAKALKDAFGDEGTMSGAYRESLAGARSMNHFVALPRLYAFGQGYLEIR